MNKHTSHANTLAHDKQILAGIGTELQTMSRLPLGGTTYTPTSLAAFIQSRIDAVNAVSIAKASWHDAVKAYDAIDTQGAVVVRDLRNLVIAAFGETSPKLAAFGFSPPKLAMQTPEEKVAFAQRRRATRMARGKKQKAKIVGTPVTAPPAAPAIPATVRSPDAPAAPKQS